MPSLCDYFITNACNAKFLISSLIGAYVAYYFFVARSSPVLYGHSRKLVDFFHSYVPFLNEVYSPFVFGFTGRVQTILRPIFHRVEKLNYEEEVISFSDGGDMTLSWSNIEGMADDTPIVALLPGLAGCGCCHYIASIVKEINRCKYRCVILNNRGGCRRKLKTPRIFCAAHTSDVASVFDHIRNRYPDAPMVAVGISLGALLIFNYLADEPQDRNKPCPLTAAMCVCMPWDLLQTSDKLEKSLDWFLFNKPLIRGLRRLVMRNADVLSTKYDVPRILKYTISWKHLRHNVIFSGSYRTIRLDHDDDHGKRVLVLHRVSCVWNHMASGSGCWTSTTKKPIFSANQTTSLPMEAVNASGCRVVLALTRHGGHIGFLDGFLPTGPSLLDRAVPQFVSAVFQHPEDFAVAVAAATDDAVEDTNVGSEGDESNSRKKTTATFY
uniref:Abhydrolase domain containing protein 3 n=1 Tax=Echinococcus granulosus TaxID=6210 RepID=A0A068X4K8_ECHGR|nr:abhydrolase domain containing protein 3 [Echinococcus granulosus]